MPLPSRNKDESKENFISRCMSDDKVKTEFPDQSQRVAVCTSKAMENAQSMEIADVVYNIEMFGFTEDINEENFYVPTQAEYVDFGDETEEWDIAQAKPGKSKAGYKYKDPQTGEVYEFDRKGVYTKNGRTLIPAYSAEYQGRKVTLNKPFRTPDGPKKFAVYTKNGSGKVVIVRFGDPNMEIKRDDPARRKSFRARHKCDTAPGPKWKARYWSCRMW